MSIQVSPITTAVGAKPVLDQADAYLTQLLAQRQALKAELPGVTAEWLQQLRDRAAEQVHQLILPTVRDEEWRFTDLSPLQQISFQSPDLTVRLAMADVASFILTEAERSRLVFVNGVYAPELSAVDPLPLGLFIGSLAELPPQYQQQVQYYLGRQGGGEEVFTALNSASFLDSAVIWVPKNLVVDQPVHLLFVSTAAEPTISQPRCLVIAEPSSALTLVEVHAAAGAGAYLTNSVTELWIQENAQVNHTRVQRDGEAFHIGKTAIAQARHSRYIGNAINLGAKLSRHNLIITQTGEQAETNLNGLTLIRGSQLADTHSAITYTQPHGSSRQLHKCIVGDRAHAVFNGKVFVPKAAQQTDAGQLNRNLLLSPKARVDTKPQLEIVADDVKCTHGATVSQLDAEEVFYLQSRGLDSASAHNLLIQAFAAEIIEQIPLPSLRKTLSDAVLVS